MMKAMEYGMVALLGMLAAAIVGTIVGNFIQTSFDNARSNLEHVG